MLIICCDMINVEKSFELISSCADIMSQFQLLFGCFMLSTHAYIKKGNDHLIWNFVMLFLCDLIFN